MVDEGIVGRFFETTEIAFVGARNQLLELKESLYLESAQNSLTAYCNERGIEFLFIPPRTPHFERILEAAVKTAKNLLWKPIELAMLTHEMLETVLVEVETILNSRTLKPLSSDPNDLTVLTPGHFFFGEPLTAQINPDESLRKATLLSD